MPYDCFFGNSVVKILSPIEQIVLHLEKEEEEKLGVWFVPVHRESI